MKDIGVITGLLVISLASLTFSYQPQYQNGLTNAYENNVPSINGGFINQILKNVLEFIRGIIAQLYERNPKDDENKFNKNEKLLNDKFNGPDQYYNDEDSSKDEISNIGNTNIINNNNKNLNSNINTIDGRSYVNGGEYEIVQGGDLVLDLPCGTYTGLKSWKQLKGKERQMAEEAVKKQNNGSLTFSGSVAATNLSDSHETNESQYSDEEPLVEPKIEITKDGWSGNKIGNVDMSGKSDSPKPRNMPNINFGGRGYPFGNGGIDSNGNNYGIRSLSNFGNVSMQNKQGVIENHNNINCDEKTLEYNGKTYVDSEFEIEKGGKINRTTKISKIQLKGLKKARQLSPEEVEWVKEKLKSCYEPNEESEESEEYSDESEEYEED